MSTTMIYTHVLNKGGRGVRSPLDGLDSLGALVTPAGAAAGASAGAAAGPADTTSSREPPAATRPMLTGSAQITPPHMVDGVAHKTGWRGDLRR